MGTTIHHAEISFGQIQYPLEKKKQIKNKSLKKLERRGGLP